jgi:hypothetical protein
MGSDTNYEDTRDEDFHRNNKTLREFEEKYLEGDEMETEQFINQQVAQKLSIFNYDLQKKKGNHHLEYFSWVIIVCAWLFIALQIIRCVGR